MYTRMDFSCLPHMFGELKSGEAKSTNCSFKWGPAPDSMTLLCHFEASRQFRINQAEF